MNDPCTAHFTAQPDSRLEQLMVEYGIAKAEFDEADERLKSIKTAIKAELVSAAPGSTRIRATSDEVAKPLILRWASRWQLDTKRLKEEQLEIYVRYGKQGGRWELREED